MTDTIDYENFPPARWYQKFPGYITGPKHQMSTCPSQWILQTGRFIENLTPTVALVAVKRSVAIREDGTDATTFEIVNSKFAGWRDSWVTMRVPRRGQYGVDAVSKKDPHDLPGVINA